MGLLIPARCSPHTGTPPGKSALGRQQGRPAQREAGAEKNNPAFSFQQVLAQLSLPEPLPAAGGGVFLARLLSAVGCVRQRSPTPDGLCLGALDESGEAGVPGIPLSTR